MSTRNVWLGESVADCFGQRIGLVIGGESSQRGMSWCRSTRHGRAANHVCKEPGIYEFRTCRLLRQPGSTRRHVLRIANNKVVLVRWAITCAGAYVLYGYSPVTRLLRGGRWFVGQRRFHLIWRQEELNMPEKQLRRIRLR